MRKSDKHSATARRTIKEKYRMVFENPTGRDVLIDIMKNCFVLKSTHVPNDPTTSAMQEGCRVVALNLLGRLGYDYTEFIEQSMKEQQEHYESLRNMARATK
jgi:hypothetical protein